MVTTKKDCEKPWHICAFIGNNEHKKNTVVILVQLIFRYTQVGMTATYQYSANINADKTKEFKNVLLPL